MSRNLSTERPFLIITDFEEHPILQSYRIMNATFILPTEDIDFNQYGTVICVSTSDGYFSAVATQCSSRFFGIIIKYGYLQVMPKSTYCPSAKLESAYIGIPTSHSKENCPDGFWEVTYPHITIVPPNHNIHNYAGMIREYVYSYSELISTENTYTHHVLIGEEPHHITRMVRIGMKPVIAGKEIVSGMYYSTRIGYSVIM